MQKMMAREYRKQISRSKSKYGNRKVKLDGHIFDSQMEAKYYQQLKWLKMAGEIHSFGLQPEFILQPGYTKNGKKVRPIKYIADFLVNHHDYTTEIIDIKGKPTQAFLLKKKMFEYKYPDLTLKVLTERNGRWEAV